LRSPKLRPEATWSASPSLQNNNTTGLGPVTWHLCGTRAESRARHAQCLCVQLRLCKGIMLAAPGEGGGSVSVFPHMQSKSMSCTRHFHIPLKFHLLGVYVDSSGTAVEADLQQFLFARPLLQCYISRKLRKDGFVQQRT